MRIEKLRKKLRVEQQGKKHGEKDNKCHTGEEIKWRRKIVTVKEEIVIKGN